jgi:hypothetical protein
MYTMLQTPSIGGVRRFAGDRNGHGVCMKKTVLRGFRAQSVISSSDSLLVGASN